MAITMSGDKIHIRPHLPLDQWRERHMVLVREKQAADRVARDGGKKVTNWSDGKWEKGGENGGYVLDLAGEVS